MLFIFSGCANDANVESTEKPVLNTGNNTVEDNVSETPEATEAVAPTVYSVTDKVIVIDAGHGINSYNKQEPIAPDSGEMKNAFAGGTRGKNQTEEELNLSVALKLQAVLEEMGAKVYMTRTEHNCDMTNIDRAELGNSVNADLNLRIHADGSENSGIHGVSVLVPGTQYISDSDLIGKSRKIGECVLSEFVKETGAADRGISVRNDLTGFNWSKVPVILVEMGFMTNPDEDALMETDDYQNKMVNGIVNGLENYFSI